MTIVCNLPQDRESQIQLALAFYPFWGEKAPPLCKACGGIKDLRQSKTRRCLCGENHNPKINKDKA